MPFNVDGAKNSVVLSAFGGLVTESQPSDLPEGSSPLTYDTDFNVGSVFTRSGLASVYGAGPSGNIVYLKTFETDDGTIRTLLLDASGNVWLENVTTSPGTLSQITTFTAGDRAKSTSAYQREYICLSQGDQPRQYDGTNFDRISQEGPGAGPGLVQISSNQASITAFSITSNIVTFTATNSFTAGQIVQISSLKIGTYLNGKVMSVQAAGLSGSQFEAAFTDGTTHANVTSTSDTGTAAPFTLYPISTLTQPAAYAGGPGGTHQLFWLWSSAPNVLNSGNVITIYFAGGGPPDTTMTGLLAQGLPVYVFLRGFSNTNINGTFQVVSTGTATIRGTNQAPSFYFTINAPFSQLAQHQETSSAVYQITMGTLTLSNPIPGVQIGSQLALEGITGSPQTNWNTTWNVINTPRNGVMNITQTQSDASFNAIYTYTVISGSNPVAGDLVTVLNTFNDGGKFNGVDMVIASATGTTFTVANFPDASVGTLAETGSAQSSGNQFNIDPGPNFVGGPSASSPIFGNVSAVGNAVNTGSTQNIAAGTRQCVVMFLTRNGYLTHPSPPITFTLAGNSTGLIMSNIPVGPPNVIARWIAFTEAGSNGVPGAFFYVIPNPVNTLVNGQPYVYAPTVIPDNVTTSFAFNFTDAVLLSSLEIDVQGNNQFNLQELGSSQWNIQYADRMFYGLEQNKVPNFLNLSFNGGQYLGNPTPLGWAADGSNGGASASLVASPQFGQSLQITNTTGSTAAVIGMLTQGAYQDTYKVPILLPQTAYSVRLVAKLVASGTGNIVVDLVDQVGNGNYGKSYGSFSVPFSSLTASLQEFTGTLLTSPFTTVSSQLALRIYCTSMTNNATVLIDRMEIFPTAQPTNQSQLRVSYINNPEAFDGVTGVLGVASQNRQPINGAFVMYDDLYLLKSGSMYSTSDSANSEPSGWSIKEVSNRVGTCGPFSYDVGEEWMVTANRNGLYIFSGKQPVKISQEIQSIWELINWQAAGTIWVRNDIVNRRILVGVPMSTPNTWLPNAPTVTNPTSPNVILMLNYQGLNDVTELENGAQMHVTMFGTLMSVDMRRKWSIWQIASPYADFITRQDGFNAPLFIGNGKANGKTYQLLPTQLSDDGVAINSLYTTWGFVNAEKAGMNPMLGFHRKLYSYLQMLASGSGNMAITLLRNSINDTQPWTVAGGITLAATPTDDYERPINVSGNRVFVQFSTNAVGASMLVSRVILVGSKHPVLPIRGNAAQ